MLKSLIAATQALKVILQGPVEGHAVLPALLVKLPPHSAAILRHAQLDPSCKLCSSSDSTSSDDEEALAVLHALNCMAGAASHAQLQELLLRSAGSSAAQWQREQRLPSTACCLARPTATITTAGKDSRAVALLPCCAHCKKHLVVTLLLRHAVLVCSGCFAAVILYLL
jgi:hypothetical protein